MPRLLDLGDAALTLEFGDHIDPEFSAKVLATRDALAAVALDGVTDVVPTWRSLTVHFDPLRLDRQLLADCLLRCADTPTRKSALATRWQIPVCFGGEHGPDLDAVATATRHPPESVIDALCATELRVFLLGFLPGFPYLGELPEWLRLPRRATPRSAVPANSLAIAGAQAAIYPWVSPGGWHLLGRTPVRLFDLANEARPALFAPGDSLRFTSIPADRYQQLHAAVVAGEIKVDQWRLP